MTPTTEEIVAAEQAAHEAEQAAQRERTAVDVLNIKDAPDGLKAAAADVLAGGEPEDDETGEAGPETDGEGLFDRSQYDDPALQLPKIDGQSVDRIRLNFTGSVDLDRSDAADVALFRKLVFGKGSITLRVEGTCKKTGGAILATTKEGEGAELVLAEKQLKVTTVYVPTPEEL